MNDLISDDFQSPEDLNELFASIRTKGIDVLDRQPVLPSTASEREFGQQDVQATEEVEPELVSGALDKTDDPLRIYLRQMGLVDLLTRQGTGRVMRDQGPFAFPGCDSPHPRQCR